MLRSLYPWFLRLGAACALSACCVNNTCDCQDTYDSVVFFRFNVDPSTKGSFTPQEVATIFILRKPVNPLSTVKPDTLRIVRPLTDAGDSVALGANLTFPSSALRFTKYRYKIWPAALPERTFDIDSLRVESTFDDVSGCCTCSKNIRKDLRLNGASLNVMDQTGNDKPVYVILSKP